MSRNKTWKRSSEASVAQHVTGQQLYPLVGALQGQAVNAVSCVEDASGGQAWDPFRQPLSQQTQTRSSIGRPVTYAKRKPHQLVRAAPAALPAIQPCGAQVQAATNTVWPEHKQLGHAIPCQAQPAQALPPAQQYARTRQMQLVLKPPQQQARPGLAVHASCAAQPKDRSAVVHASGAAPSGPQTSSKSVQAMQMLARRPRYAKERPNQLQRLPSLSPSIGQGQQGRAASAQDSPATRLRALLAKRLTPSQQGPQRRSSSLTRGGSTPVRARLGLASKVYVRPGATSAKSGRSQAAAVRSVSGNRSRFVFLRSSLQAPSQGSSSDAATVQRLQPAGVAKQRAASAARRLRVQCNRQGAAGKTVATAPRRPAQLRRLGSQMYSVTSSRTLRRQATPAKPLVARQPAKSPGSQLKRTPQYVRSGASLQRVQQQPKSAAKSGMAARVLARAVTGKRATPVHALRPAASARGRSTLGTGTTLLCLGYCRTGKCEAQTTGRCKLIHDRSKVAVCPRWLAGSCSATDCKLQHVSQPDLMPLCTFHLKGACTKEGCPYLHRDGSIASAPVCRAYVSGYCPRGTRCPHRHLTARMVKELRATRSLTAAALKRAQQGTQQGQAADDQQEGGMPPSAAEAMQIDQAGPQRKRKWRYFWAEEGAED